jgi:hypothetical protein
VHAADLGRRCGHEARERVDELARLVEVELLLGVIGRPQRTGICVRTLDWWRRI